MSVAQEHPAIPQFFDRRAQAPLVGTYTILSSFLNCEHQMYRRYLKRDQTYVETPEMKWGNDVHAAFEHRIGARKPLPDNMRQWEPLAAPFDGKVAAVEQKLGVTRKGAPTGFYDKDVWFRAKLDLALVEGATAYLLDWKTGGSKYEDPFELEIGAVLLKAKRPHITKIVGSYAWLKENRIGQLYDLSDFEGTWNRMVKLMGQIADKQATGDFEKHRSGLCGWCSVSDCENWKERK